MISKLKFLPINNRTLIDSVVDSANSDKVNLIKADYAAVKEGEVIGAVGIAPMVFWWGHSRKMTFLDSFAMYASMDAVMRSNHGGTYYIPCERSSPYHALLTKRLRLLDSMEGETDWSIFINE